MTVRSILALAVWLIGSAAFAESAARSSVDYRLDFGNVEIGKSMLLTPSVVTVKARVHPMSIEAGAPALTDESGDEIDITPVSGKERMFALFQLKCKVNTCAVSGRFAVTYKFGTPKLTFLLLDYSDDADGPADVTLSEVREKSANIRVGVTGYASFYSDIRKLVLQKHPDFQSRGWIEVDLSELSDAELERFLNECYESCAQIKASGYLDGYVGRLSALKVEKY